MIEKGSDLKKSNHRFCVYWLIRADVAGGWTTRSRFFETLEGAREFGREVAKQKIIRGHATIKDRNLKWNIIEKVG